LGLARLDSPQFIPFFSRNVGLLDGAQIPIDAGVKINGLVGKWNLGILDVQTRETIVPDQIVRDLGLASAVVPGTNLFAGRVSYDFNENLRIGTILTHGDPEARRNNTLAGIDAVWRTSKFFSNKNLQLGAWTATTQGDVGPGSKVGWGLSADYPNDLLDCNASVNHFGDALEPLLGFLPRRGHAAPMPSAPTSRAHPRTVPSAGFARSSLKTNTSVRAKNLKGAEIDEAPQYAEGFFGPLQLDLDEITELPNQT